MRQWNERSDFREVTTHYGVLELFRDRLGRHGFDVAAGRQSEDGRGAVRINKNGEWSAVPYHLPEDLERLERVARQIGETTGTMSARQEA